MKERKISVSTKQCPEILEHFAETSQEFIEQKLTRISWLDFAEKCHCTKEHIKSIFAVKFLKDYWNKVLSDTTEIDHLGCKKQILHLESKEYHEQKKKKKTKK